MVRPNVLRVRKDPIALEVDAKYPGVKMPNLRLSETDARDLIVFIETQSKRVDAERLKKKASELKQ